MRADSQPFLAEGKLTNLHWERGRENLLAKVNEHYQRNAVITGVGTAVGDLFGQVANSAMLAMYDGEDTQNFMCLINDEPACGQFGGAEHLPEGGNIKAVVSRREGVLYVHAVLENARKIVWVNHPWGGRAQLWVNAKLALYLFVFSTICFALFSWWASDEKVGFWMLFSYFFLGGLGLAAIMFLWSLKDLSGASNESTEYFRLLGFEKPHLVNLNFPYYSEMLNKDGEPPPEWWDMSEYQYRNMYSLRAATKAGAARLISPKRAKRK
jgi:hypothetical protein